VCVCVCVCVCSIQERNIRKLIYTSHACAINKIIENQIRTPEATTKPTTLALKTVDGIDTAVGCMQHINEQFFLMNLAKCCKRLQEFFSSASYENRY